MEVDRFVRQLEDSEFARLHGLGNGKASRTERDPANGVIGRRVPLRCSIATWCRNDRRRGNDVEF